MKRIIVTIALLVIALAAQTSGPSFLTFAPLGPAANCVSSSAGDVLCAATDGFYISIAAGPFQKVATGTIPPPATTISCTTASLSTGSTGTFTASGCTIK